MKSEFENLIADAIKVAKSAYAPYSHYKVGAAVLGDDGSIYRGCNVENSSFGATICAERSAISTCIAEGCHKIQAIAVATADCEGPCGICLQVINEFAIGPEMPIILCSLDGENRVERSLRELFPHPFKLTNRRESPYR